MSKYAALFLFFVCAGQAAPPESPRKAPRSEMERNQGASQAGMFFGGLGPPAPRAVVTVRPPSELPPPPVFPEPPSLLEGPGIEPRE